MRKLFLTLPMLCVAFAAAADPSATISNMSCASVQSAIRANGSMILHWRSKRGMPLYGRYVSDRRFCRPGQNLSFASVPAADKACTVKTCVERVSNY